MKEMNKEELIEYFISLLGDNHVLGKYISLEEIKARLEKNIEHVEFVDCGARGFSSYYNAMTKTIKIDSSLSNPQIINSVIVHELLHAISCSNKTNNGVVTSKVGLELDQHLLDGHSWKNMKNWFYAGNNKYRLLGRCQNEGLTEILVDEILRKR